MKFCVALWLLSFRVPLEASDLQIFSKPFSTGGFSEVRWLPAIAIAVKSRDLARILLRRLHRIFPDFFVLCFLGGHLKPVTLKPVIRIFSSFSTFSCPHFPCFPRFCSAESPQTLVFIGVRGTFRIFRIFPVSVSNR